MSIDENKNKFESNTLSASNEINGFSTIYYNHFIDSPHGKVRTHEILLLLINQSCLNEPKNKCIVFNYQQSHYVNPKFLYAFWQVVLLASEQSKKSSF